MSGLTVVSARALGLRNQHRGALAFDDDACCNSDECWCRGNELHEEKLRNEERRRIAARRKAKQAACPHSRRAAIFEGTCPDCGFVGDPL